MLEYLRSLGEYFVDKPLKLLWVVITIIVMLFIIRSLVRSPENGGSKMSITNLFIDGNGIISDSKFRMNIAFLTTTWVLTYLAISDTLTEWYLIGYLTAWVIDRANSRLSYSKRLSTKSRDLVDDPRDGYDLDDRLGRDRIRVNRYPPSQPYSVDDSPPVRRNND
jgi:hypothetical protein